MEIQGRCCGQQIGRNLCVITDIVEVGWRRGRPSFPHPQTEALQAASAFQGRFCKCSWDGYSDEFPRVPPDHIFANMRSKSLVRNLVSCPLARPEPWPQ